MEAIGWTWTFAAFASVEAPKAGYRPERNAVKNLPLIFTQNEETDYSTT
jgi:hypothetical protein